MKGLNSFCQASLNGKVLLLLVLTSVALLPARPSSAQKLTTLYSFTTSNSIPVPGLVADHDGNLYGATKGGADGDGAVFKLASTGAFTTLHSFTGGRDGGVLFDGVVADSEGNLYGTTASGGAYGNGTVFKVTPGGSETTLFAFSGSGADGYLPATGVTIDRYDNLFGTTVYGGANGTGTIFKVTPRGVGTVLYSFPAFKFPLDPSGLVVDAHDNLYGTTAGNGANGYGEAYELEPSGFYKILYFFTSEQDFGGIPISQINGYFYFMSPTNLPGEPGVSGNVYWAAPSGAVTLLDIYSSAAGGASPGVYPPPADQLGNIYIVGGGTAGFGAIYKVAPTGVATLLHTFTGGEDGGNPNGGLIADNGGHIYGTTTIGGEGQNGTVFKVSLPGAFVGTPGEADCAGRSISGLALEYGGIARAARELGYENIEAMNLAVDNYCH